MNWYAEGASCTTTSYLKADVLTNEKTNVSFTNISHLKIKNITDANTADIDVVYDTNGNINLMFSR